MGHVSFARRLVACGIAATAFAFPASAFADGLVPAAPAVPVPVATPSVPVATPPAPVAAPVAPVAAPSAPATPSVAAPSVPAVSVPAAPSVTVTTKASSSRASAPRKSSTPRRAKAHRRKAHRAAPLRRLAITTNAELPADMVYPLDPCTGSPVFVTGTEKLGMSIDDNGTSLHIHTDLNYQNVVGYGIAPSFDLTSPDLPTAGDLTDLRYQPNLTTKSMDQDTPKTDVVYVVADFELIALNSVQALLGKNLLIHSQYKVQNGVVTLDKQTIECTAPGPPTSL